MKKFENNFVVSKDINKKEYPNIAIYNDALDGLTLLDIFLSDNGITNEFIQYLGNYVGSDFFLDTPLHEYRLEKNRVHLVGKLYSLFDEYQKEIKQNGIDTNEFTTILFTYSTKTNKLYLTIGQEINGYYSSFSFDNDENRLTPKDLFDKEKIVKLLTLE